MTFQVSRSKKRLLDVPNEVQSARVAYSPYASDYFRVLELFSGRHPAHVSVNLLFDEVSCTVYDPPKSTFFAISDRFFVFRTIFLRFGPPRATFHRFGMRFLRFGPPRGNILVFLDDDFIVSEPLADFPRKVTFGTLRSRKYDD